MSKHIGLLKKTVVAAVTVLLCIVCLGCGRKKSIPITAKSKAARKTFLHARNAGEYLHLDRATELLSKAIKLDPDFALA